MNRYTLLARSLRHYTRAHVGTVLGAAIGSAVLIGALVVGDSVRGSLRDMALARIGTVDFALASRDRLFQDALAGAFSTDDNRVKTAPVLQLPATAATASGSARANHVQLTGVDQDFWNLALENPGFGRVPEDRVVLNQSLQAQLGAREGDTLVFRVQKPTQLSRDAPLAPEEDTAVALRLTVHAIASDAEFGRFSLQASQVAPFNAFVDMAYLQTKLDVAGRANLLLVQAPPDWTVTNAIETLDREWTLADAQLEWLDPAQPADEPTPPPAESDVSDVSVLELRTPRVFMDPPLSQAALEAVPGAAGILTYFVNDIRSADSGSATPYSMVTAAGPPWTPADMADDEIVINRWLADDLGVSAGANLRLTYFVVGLGRELTEASRDFRVRQVIEMTGLGADRTLMPDFPGLTDAENCRDWDTGFPIDLERIRDKDEAYWDEYRGAPKAWVTLDAGRQMWRNRFGDLTAVRFPPGTDRSAVAAHILGTVAPAEVGLQFQTVRERALDAVNQAQDFGGLFLGFSFFLITAALLLMALLFQFSVENRATETGILLALGLKPRFVRRQLLMEGAVLGLAGAVLGLAGGVAYARVMVHGLTTIWRDAVGTTALTLHVQPVTLVSGTVLAFAVAWSIIWLGLRRQIRRPARTLLAAGAEAGFQMDPAGAAGPGGTRSRWIGGVSAAAAIALVVWAAAAGAHQSAGAFFGAGALLLISGLAFSSALLGRLGLGNTAAPSSRTLAVRNVSRRRKRSLATIGLLACGSFLVVAVGANKLDAVRNADARASGTGGFAFFAESALPVVQDLNGPEGREYFGLDRSEFSEVRFVPFRLREGEDASCLNLNRAQQPRVLGVNPGLLSDRGAFTFTKTVDAKFPDNPWQWLNERSPDGPVPAVADHNSILWAMGKQVGDTLDYVDEQGNEFQVRLVGAVANSILQGNIIIAEEEFVRRYPSASGYQVFLIDAPAGQRDEVSKSLSRLLQDVGFEITPSVRRLNGFNDVQNTYLSTFQLLGGLGLILGSVGLGIVVLRNVSERRGELALLNAVGFRPSIIRRIIIWEHGALLLAGLVIGVIAALIAVFPALISPGVEPPTVSLIVTLLAVLGNGMIWTWLAAGAALRGSLLDSLRDG